MSLDDDRLADLVASSVDGGYDLGAAGELGPDAFGPDPLVRQAAWARVLARTAYSVGDVDDGPAGGDVQPTSSFGAGGPAADVVGDNYDNGGSSAESADGGTRFLVDWGSDYSSGGDATSSGAGVGGSDGRAA